MPDFDADTPVAHFGPRSHVRYQDRKAVLWPAYVYRVMAPLMRDRQINAFERAVLRLVQAGETRPERLAELLALAPDLVDYVWRNVRDRGLIRADGRPSAKGVTVLADELDLNQAMSVAYAFQDPISNRLWPRLTERLNFVDAEWDPQETTAHVTLNTVGNPKHFWAYAKKPSAAYGPRTPEPGEIMSAARLHRRAMRFGASQETEGEDGDTSVDPLPQLPALAGIAVIDEEPRPIWLATEIYTSADPDDADWYVCDPFGFGHSPWLWRLVDTERARDPQLHKRVQDLISQKLPDDETASSQLVTLQAWAESDISGRFPKLRGQAPDIFATLVELAGSYRDIGRQGHVPTGRLKAAVLQAGVVLEAVCDHLQRKYTDTRDAQRLARNDPLLTPDGWEKVAGFLGFHVPLPRSLTTVPDYKVKNAYLRPSGTLGARLLAILLAASRQENHPLRRAAERAPDLLHRIGAVVDARVAGAHYQEIEVDTAWAEQHVSTAYDVVRLLLDHAESET